MVYINSISSYFPETARSNEEIIENYQKFASEVDYSITSERIVEQCGIEKRYVSHPNHTAKDLGNSVAKRLFEEWDIDKASVEYLIFVSDALEYKGPTTACVMQHDLGLPKSIQAIDILHGCTGWVYGLSLAKALIVSQQVSNVLLITADVPSKVMHPEDIELTSIFSDAAAATFISNQKLSNGLNMSIDQFVFGTDGRGEKSLFVDRSATKEPPTVEWLSQYAHLPKGLLTGGRLAMNSAKIFLFALRIVPKLIQQVLKKHQLGVNDIDYFVLHQANGTMLEFIRKRMKLPKEKFIINLKDIGNTVSASIPIAITELKKEQQLNSNTKILIAGFGIGFSWGGTVITVQ